MGIRRWWHDLWNPAEVVEAPKPEGIRVVFGSYEDCMRYILETGKPAVFHRLESGKWELNQKFIGSDEDE